MLNVFSQSDILKRKVIILVSANFGGMQKLPISLLMNNQSKWSDTSSTSKRQPMKMEDNTKYNTIQYNEIDVKYLTADSM